MLETESLVQLRGVQYRKCQWAQVMMVLSMAPVPSVKLYGSVNQRPDGNLTNLRNRCLMMKVLVYLSVFLGNGGTLQDQKNVSTNKRRGANNTLGESSARTNKEFNSLKEALAKRYILTA